METAKGRTGLTVAGAITLVLAALVLAAAGAVLWQLGNADGGYVSSGAHRFQTSSHAIVTESVKVDSDIPRWLIGRARVTATSSDGKPVFVGVARKRDVDAYLANVNRSQIRDLEYGDFKVTYESRAGTASPAPPASRSIWAASTSGTGDQQLTWRVRSGEWRVVLMNADGSSNVSADVTVGGRVNHALIVSLGVLGGGLLLLLLGASLVPLAVAAAAVAAYGRLRPGLRAGIALAFGVLALVAAGIATAGGVSGSDVTGVLLFPAGAALVALGVVVPWRMRGRAPATRRRRWINRGVAVVLGFLIALFGVLPVSLALWTTGKYRSSIGTFVVPHRDVTFTTADGLRLSGWYVPSRNGAAVLIVHGGGGDRDGARRHAALLARAGYGVLLYDARGRGRSDGDPDAYGWTWGPDVDAAATWLEHRPDVRHGEVGALGLSTGADVLVEAAARRRDIKAIVADGTTSRSTADTRRLLHGADLLSLPTFVVQYAAAVVLEDARPGPPLAQLAARVPPTPILFIASSWKVERDAAPIYARAAAASSTLWRVDAGHTQGLREHPREYRRRVVGFFHRTLLASP